MDTSVRDLDIEAAKAYHRARERQRRADREAERRQWLAMTREAVRRLAPQYPDIRRVYLFGSLVQPGRFGSTSDIDVAIVCEELEAESAFWRALEHALRRDVDMRPYESYLADVVERTGVLVYER